MNSPNVVNVTKHITVNFKMLCIYVILRIGKYVSLCDRQLNG